MSHYFLPVNPCCTNVVNPCGCSSTTSNTGPCNTTLTASSTIAYDGLALSCTTIEPSDTLNVVLQKIDEVMCNLLGQINTLTTEVDSLNSQITTINGDIIYINNILDVCCPNVTTTTSSSSTSTSTSTTTTTTTTINPGDIVGLWAWYKGDVGVIGTTEVTNWEDQSILGNDLNTESTYFPEAASDVVGTLNATVIKKVDYSTLANMRTVANFPDISSTGVSIFIVGKVISSPEPLCFVVKAADIQMFTNSTPSINGRVGVNTLTTLTSSIALGTYYTFRLEGDLNNQSLAINNNTPVTSNDADYFSLNIPFRIFAQTGPYPSPTEQGDVAFAEIIVYNTALTPTETLGIETYLKNKYNHY